MINDRKHLDRCSMCSQPGLFLIFILFFVRRPAPSQSESSQIDTRVSGVKIASVGKRDSLLSRAGELREKSSNTLSKPISVSAHVQFSRLLGILCYKWTVLITSWPLLMFCIMLWVLPRPLLLESQSSRAEHCWFPLVLYLKTFT